MAKIQSGHLLLIAGLAIAAIVLFLQKFKVVERFSDCWCRSDGATLSAGDLTSQLKRFAQILTNSKWLVAREAGTDMLYYAPVPLKPDTQWKYMNGLLGNIALSDKYILGANRDSMLYAADLSSGLETAYSSPGWYNIPGAALEVAVADDKLFVINAAGAIYTANGSDGAKATWTNISGAGYNIGYDSVNKKLIVRGTDNAKYLCDYPCSPSNWIKQA